MAAAKIFLFVIRRLKEKEIEMSVKQGDSVNYKYVCRLAARSANSVPVEITKGDSPPKEVGDNFYYTTPGGKPIAFPNAYKWPKVYHPSTLKIQVGEKWLAKKENQAVYDLSDGVRCVIFPGRARRVGNIRIVPGYHGRKSILLFQRGKRTYHYQGLVPLKPLKMIPEEEIVSLVNVAKDAWARQDKIKKKERFIRRKISKVYVSVNDCLSIGACMVGIKAFAKKNLKIKDLTLVEQGKISVPASRLQKVGKGNNFVSLAIQRAAERTFSESIPA